MKIAGSKDVWFSQKQMDRCLNSRQSLLIKSLLLVLVLVTLVWFVVKIYNVHYLPASEINDGFGYFLGAKSFYLNHQLQAPLIHLNLVSPIGEFYSHGFAYSLINGGAALLFGWHDKLIIAINIFLLAGAAILILWTEQDWPWKLILLLLFLTFYLTPTMTFAYMQETIHLLLALLLGRLLMRIFDQDKPERNWPLIVSYCLFVAVVALARPTWVFWAVGLVAIARTKRDFVLFGLLAAVYVALGYLFLKFLFAPYPYYSPYEHASEALAKHQWLAAARGAVEALLQNLAHLFSNHFYIFGRTWIPNAYSFAVIGITAYLYGCYRYFGDRRALAVALISSAYVAAIFLVYDVLAGARTLGAVFILQLIYLVSARKTLIVTALAFCQIVMFPAVAAITNRIVEFQANAGKYGIQNRAQLQNVSDVLGGIDIGRRATVYLDNAFTNGEYPLTIHLPLRSDHGHALRYSQDVFAKLAMPQRKFDSRFVDFVLAAEPLSGNELTPVYDSAAFHLYKVKNG